MLTSWWRYRKSNGLAKIQRLHPLGSMNDNVQNFMAIRLIVVGIFQRDQSGGGRGTFPPLESRCDFGSSAFIYKNNIRRVRDVTEQVMRDIKPSWRHTGMLVTPLWQQWRLNQQYGRVAQYGITRCNISQKNYNHTFKHVRNSAPTRRRKNRNAISLKFKSFLSSNSVFVHHILSH